MKFLIDENVHKGLYYFLINLEYDVKLGPKSTRNGNLFSLIVNEERILICQELFFRKLSTIVHKKEKTILEHAQEPKHTIHSSIWFLTTRDSDFLNIPKYSHLNHKGIILLRIHPKDLTQQKGALSRLFSLDINTENKIVIIYSLDKFEFVHKND